MGALPKRRPPDRAAINTALRHWAESFAGLKKPKAAGLAPIAASENTNKQTDCITGRAAK